MSLYIFFFFIFYGQGEPVRKLGLVVSLGTGNGPIPEMKEISVYVPNAVKDIFKVGEQLKAASHLGQIMLSLVSYFENAAIFFLFDSCFFTKQLVKKG